MGLLKQIAATASVLGFTPVIGVSSMAVFNTDVRCVLRVIPQGNRWYTDTVYDANHKLGLQVREYTYDRNQDDVVLQDVTQYLVDYLEASKKQNKPI